ncbi:MAG: hypothetical protein AAGE96_19405 [Cyanobacteria bacterium P01_G01_bin.19]
MNQWNVDLNALKSGGRLIAEFGGKGNISSINTAIDTVLNISSDRSWYFPSIGEYCTLLEETGFRVTYAMLFSRPTKLEGETGLANWLEMFAKVRFEHLNSVAKKEAIAQIEAILRPTLYRNGSWFADYWRIRVAANKAS